MHTKKAEYFKLIEDFINDYQESNGITPTIREISTFPKPRWDVTSLICVNTVSNTFQNILSIFLYDFDFYIKCMPSILFLSSHMFPGRLGAISRLEPL